MKRINLISPETRRLGLSLWLKAEFSKSRSSLLAVSVFILILILSLWQGTALLRCRLAIESQKTAIENNKKQLEAAVAQQREITRKRAALAKRKKHVEERLSLLREAGSRGVEWSEVLAHLSGLLPDALWIDRISLEEPAITIAGTAANNTIVSDFMTRIDDSKYFKDTAFNYTRKAEFDKKPVVDFEITTLLTKDAS